MVSQAFDTLYKASASLPEFAYEHLPLFGEGICTLGNSCLNVLRSASAGPHSGQSLVTSGQQAGLCRIQMQALVKVLGLLHKLENVLVLTDQTLSPARGQRLLWQP